MKRACGLWLILVATMLGCAAFRTPDKIVEYTSKTGGVWWWKGLKRLGERPALDCDGLPYRSEPVRNRVRFPRICTDHGVEHACPGVHVHVSLDMWIRPVQKILARFCHTCEVMRVDSFCGRDVELLVRFVDGGTRRNESPSLAAAVHPRANVRPDDFVMERAVFRYRRGARAWQTATLDGVCEDTGEPSPECLRLVEGDLRLAEPSGD